MIESPEQCVEGWTYVADSGESIKRQASAYDSLTRSQLIALLKKREAERKLGLVWERDEIDPDKAIDSNFVVADLIAEQCERPAPWENLIIEGDNYDALRWLRMTHRGQVKCIYIDPPYNTGNKDWVYNDDYVDKAHRYRHSQWLEFLYQRLLIARDLLASDGVLLCSINDENRARLELMMDQALPGMRVGSFVWRTRVGGNEGGEHFYSSNQEHVLIFANSGFQFGGTKKTFEMYRFNDDDDRGDYRKSDLTKAHGYRERPNTFYPIYEGARNIWYPPNPNRVWAFASKSKLAEGRQIRSETIEDLIANNRISFPEDQRVEVFETKEALLIAIRSGDVPTSGRAPLLREDLPDLDFWVGKKIGWGTPAFKRYKKDLKNKTQPLSSWITPNAEADTVLDDANMIVSGTNDEGAKVIKDVFGEKAFNYAKPVSLIRELVRQSTSPGDLVLDFFAGSATTAQAVMELNAEDGGDRRFIMVSSTEATGDEPDKNICCDVTAERVRRLNANTDKYEELSAGFAYLRCREINPLEMDDALTPETAWSILEAHHGLPLTVWPGGKSFARHEGDEVTLVLIDFWSEAAAKALARVFESSRPVFLYAFAPGQITGIDPKANVEVRSIRETLQRLFAA